MSFSAIKPTRLDFGERYAGIEEHVDREGALIEGRQERAGQSERADASQRDRGNRSEKNRPLMLEGKVQEPSVAGLEVANQPALMLVQPLQRRQHVVRHDWRQRDRHHEASEDRDDVGFAERREETAFDAGEGKERDENKDNDKRRVDDAGTHFVGS